MQIANRMFGRKTQEDTMFLRLHQDKLDHGLHSRHQFYSLLIARVIVWLARTSFKIRKCRMRPRLLCKQFRNQPNQGWVERYGVVSSTD